MAEPSAITDLPGYLSILRYDLHYRIPSWLSIAPIKHVISPQNGYILYLYSAVSTFAAEFFLLMEDHIQYLGIKMIAFTGLNS